jgi:hypothetical protein
VLDRKDDYVIVTDDQDVAEFLARFFIEKVVDGPR